MARLIHADPNLVVGLRAHLTKTARDLIVRLERADRHHGFTADIDRLRQRVNDLLGDADVLVYRHEIPADMQPPRTDGQHVYTLHGDSLRPARYQRVAPAVGP